MKQKLANRDGNGRKRSTSSGNLKLPVWTQAARSSSTCGRMPHLDYGYAVTSHSSQGQTADRVLVHVDSDRRRTASCSTAAWRMSRCRGRSSMCRCTRTMPKTLGHTLSPWDVSHPSAMQQSIHDELAGQKIEPQSVGMEISQALSLSR